MTYLSVDMVKDIYAERDQNWTKQTQYIERETALTTVSRPDNNYKGCN